MKFASGCGGAEQIYFTRALGTHAMIMRTTKEESHVLIRFYLIFGGRQIAAVLTIAMVVTLEATLNVAGW